MVPRSRPRARRDPFQTRTNSILRLGAHADRISQDAIYFCNLPSQGRVTPMLPNALLHLIGKRAPDTNDCAVAALASYLGRRYEEGLCHAARVSPTVWKDWLTSKQILRVARSLGVTAKWYRVFDRDEDT